MCSGKNSIIAATYIATSTKLVSRETVAPKE